MADPVTWGILISAALAAYQGVSTHNANVDQIDAENEATAKQNARDQAELTRQQEETNKADAEAKSDRIRQAEKELSFLQVAGADAGSGQMSMAQQVSELGFVEGQDLARLESNRAGQVDAMQSKKEGSREGVTNTITQGRNSAKASQTTNTLNTVEAGINAGDTYFKGRTGGSGVQIPSNTGPYASGYKFPKQS